MKLEIIVGEHGRSARRDLGILAERISDTGIRTYLDTKSHAMLRMRLGVRFASEGDDVVGTWKPLHPATVAIRSSAGYGGAHPINYRTGRMFRWMMSNSPDIDVSAASSVLYFPGRSASPDIVDKIRTAQIGKNSPKTPPRPVLGLSRVDEMMQVSGLAKYIGRGLLLGGP